tara:strand:- start:557 stop:688 length:132 start_codon:yes stop_codon:yes gene_type:complete
VTFWLSLVAVGLLVALVVVLVLVVTELAQELREAEEALKPHYP